MNNVQLRKRCCWALAIVTLVIFWCPNQSKAAAGPITSEELLYSGPFEITARIMEIDHGKNMLIVAEKAVYVVDVTVGAEHLLTVLSDAEGSAIAIESLAPGQTVLVRGIELPDGRVIAELIQLASDRDRPFRSHSDNRRPTIRQVHEIRPLK